VLQDCLGCVFAQSDQLAAAGLAAPLATRLATELRAKGWTLNPTLLTPVELIKGILAAVQSPARSIE
jgi:hypothetical protein